MTQHTAHDDAPRTTPASLPDWAKRHTGAWARVKDAFRRNWMRNTAGVTDEPVAPPAGRPGAEIVTAAIAASARAHLRSVSQPGDRAGPDRVGASDAQLDVLRVRLSELLEHAAQTRLMTDRAVRDASLRADDAKRLEDLRVTAKTAARARAEGTWRQVEHEAQFGYAARLQHPSEAWGEALEDTLRAEWAMVGSSRTWSEARAAVRCGWEYARNNT